MAQNNSSNQLGNRVLDTLSDCIFKVVESKVKTNTAAPAVIKNAGSDTTVVENKYTHPTGGAPYKASGLYKFSTDGNSHIAAVTPITQADIMGLGIASSSHEHNYAKATTYTGTLRAADWKSGTPYTQTIIISGVLASDVPIVDVNMTNAKTYDDVIALSEAWDMVYYVAATAANTIVARCFKGPPSIDIPIILQVVR